MIYYEYLNAQLNVILDSRRTADQNFVIYPFGRIRITLKEDLNKRYFVMKTILVM